MDFRQIGAAQTSHPWHRVIACAEQPQDRRIAENAKVRVLRESRLQRKKNPSLPPRAIREGNEGI